MRYSKTSKCSDLNNQGQYLEQYVAGETISALKVVYVSNVDGKIYVANNTVDVEVLRVIGVSFTSANSEESLSVVLFGEIQDASFNFEPGTDLFLTATGDISENIPTGNIVYVARAIANDKIFVNLNEEVILRS